MSRERDLGDVGMVHQPFPHHPAGAGQHLQHAFGQPRLPGQLTDTQSGERGQLRGLDDDRVSGGQGGRDAPGEDRHREVPGHDDAGHTERLGEGDAPAAGHRDLAAGVAFRGGREVLEHVAHLLRLAAGLADRVAGLADFQFGEFLDPAVDGVGDRAQHPGALARRDRAPGRVGGPGPRHGGIGLLGRGQGDRRHGLLCGRVDHVVLGHGLPVSSGGSSLPRGPAGHSRSKPRNSSQSVTVSSNAASSTRA